MESLTLAKMMVTRNDDEFEISIDGYVVYSVDHNYGADADGNRGVKKIFVEDIKNLSACTVDGEDFSLTQSEYDEAAEILADSFLNK